MLYFENPQIVDPHINLAIEEFLLRYAVGDQPIFYFYVNEPSVIVGRNQNVFEEIDFQYIRQRSIPVLRRLSGGGTVYHDPGNLNYSLISPDQNLLNDYVSFTRPVLSALRKIGLTAELRNRSSIFVGSKKVSGNAQYATGGKLVSHGTLLWDTDLVQLRAAIRPRHKEVDSRAVQSVRSSVVNLRDLLDKEISLDVVKDHVRREFLGAEGAVQYELREDDWDVVQDITEERYHSWEWNIGRSPKFSTIRRTQTIHGEVALEIIVSKGTIETVRALVSNSLNNHIVNSLRDCFKGVRYDSAEVALALQYCDLDAISLGFSEDQLISLVC